MTKAETHPTFHLKPPKQKPRAFNLTQASSTSLHLASVVVIKLPHQQRPRLVPSAEQVPPRWRKYHRRGREGGRPIAGPSPSPSCTAPPFTTIRRSRRRRHRRRGRPNSQGDAGDVSEVHHPALNANSARDGGPVVLRPPAVAPLPAGTNNRGGRTAALLLTIRHRQVGITAVLQRGTGGGRRGEEGEEAFRW